MTKTALECIQVGLIAFHDGIHAATFVTAAALLPTETTALVLAVSSVKILNFVVEANLCKLKNEKTRQTLKIGSYIISVFVAVFLSFFDLHGKEIMQRTFIYGLKLFCIIGPTIAIVDYSTHVISEIIASYPKKREKAKYPYLEILKYIVSLGFFIWAIVSFATNIIR